MPPETLIAEPAPSRVVSPAPKALEVELEVRREGAAVVRGARFDVTAGAAVGLVGPNGVGKTSLIAGIFGFLPTSGRLRAFGTDIERWPAHRRARHGLALVPQGRRLFADLTVAENLRAAQLVRGSDGPEFDVFALFPGLRALVGRRAGVLSGGQQQQVAIARALLRRPRLLLLDEPTEGLAPSVTAEVTDALVELKVGGLTLVIAEQRLDVVTQLCDEVAVMRGGEVAAHGPPASPEIRDQLHAL